MSAVMRQFAGGSLATMADFTALMAPNPNSYRRFTPYSWVGHHRDVGHRQPIGRIASDRRRSPRHASRAPSGGGDVNPYLATAAVIAGGMHGIEHRLEPPELTTADVYADRGLTATLPTSLEGALDLLAESAVAHDWFGSDFVGHYVATKRAELDAQRLAVTDWEIARYLEPL